MITAALSKRLKARDVMCLHCGETNDLVIHHRQNRGMGGSKNLDRIDNLLRVCRDLNFQMESDPLIAETAREYGWKVSKFAKTFPPVFDKVQGVWFNLNKAGEKEPVEKEEELF